MNAVRFRWPLAALVALAASVTSCDCGGEPVVERIVELALVPESVDFGEVPIGARHDAALIVRNSGNAPWEPDAPPVVDGGGFSWSSGCDAAVAPGATCTAQLSFAPAVEGPAAGTLTVRFPGSGGVDVDVTGRLRGTGTPATLVVSPPSIDFGAVTVGESRVERITLENRGTEGLDVPLAITGAGFFIDAQGAADPNVVRRVDAGASIDVEVAFAPVAGIDHVGAVTAEICGTRCGPAVALGGSGNAPRIDVQPRQLDLGSVVVGDTAHGTLTLANIGTGSLAIEGVDVDDDSGAFAVTAPALPVVLAAGENVTVDVAFSPVEGRGAGNVAVVVVRSSDPVSDTVVVPISARAPGAGLEVIPGVANYGFLDANSERRLSVVARSTGDAPVTLASVRLVGDPDFTVDGPPADGDVLAAGDALQFFVVAHASGAAVARGGASARLIVASNAGTEEVALSFSAGDTGCVPRAVIGNAAIGAVQVGLSKSGEVFVENAGDADCVLESLDEEVPGFASDDEFTAVGRGIDVIEPGRGGVVSFGFSPTSAGSRSTVRALRFVGRSEPLLVSASGSGVRGGLVGAPGIVAFGPLPRECAAPRANVAFLNDGQAPIEVVSFEIVVAEGATADVFSVVDVNGAAPQGRVLLPGQSVPLVVNTSLALAASGQNNAILRATADIGLTADINLRLVIADDVEELRQDFTVPDDILVDVLFVIDNSGSMADDQQLLADNFDRFTDAVDDPNLDIQLGITTTDVITPGAAAGRLIGSPPILDGNDGATFAERAIVGIDGTGLELGLEAMRLALEVPENAGFIRTNAALAIIFVTDEDDGGDLIDFLPDPALSRSPDEYIALLEARKAGAVQNTPVLVSAVISPFGAARYRAVVDHFGGSVLDITTPDWGNRLGDIAAETFSLARAFHLAAAPRPGSVHVTIDGVETTEFHIDDARTAVVLDEPAAGGSDVVITYVAQCGG